MKYLTLILILFSIQAIGQDNGIRYSIQVEHNKPDTVPCKMLVTYYNDSGKRQDGIQLESENVAKEYRGYIVHNKERTKSTYLLNDRKTPLNKYMTVWMSVELKK